MRLRGLAAALACAISAVAVQPAFGAAPPSFADGTRDAARGAPELTTVLVSNDDTGAIRFRINVGNQPRLARDASLALFLDTDRNPGTGDPLSLGADYRFVLDGASQTFDFARWDGSRYDPTAASATAQVWYWSGVSITINRSELGGTAALAFWIRAGGAGQASDAAPDQGTWNYDLVTGGTNPPDIDSFSYRVRPAAPRAGTTWRLEVDRVRLTGTSATARPDRWSCSATLGGRPFRGSGPGGCTFRLPRSARRKRLAVTVTVAYMGEVVTGTLTVRVR
jgi:hypothetical protein